MKLKRSLQIGFLLVVVFYTHFAQAQEKLDTIRLTKDQFTLIKKHHRNCFYQVENKFVVDCPTDYSTFFASSILSTSKPVVLALYYDKSFKSLYSIGKVSGSSYVGAYKAYSPEGRLTVSGQFTPKDSLTSGDRNLESGVWKIYDEKGKELRKERWKQGVFIGEKGWAPLPLYGVNIQVNGETNHEKSVSIATLKSIELELLLKDYDVTYGRFECRLMITGGKSPLKQLSVDYSSLKYFDFKKFLTEFWQEGSSLFIEVEDKKTKTYFNTYLKIEA